MTVAKKKKIHIIMLSKPTCLVPFILAHNNDLIFKYILIHKPSAFIKSVHSIYEYKIYELI